MTRRTLLRWTGLAMLQPLLAPVAASMLGGCDTGNGGKESDPMKSTTQPNAQSNDKVSVKVFNAKGELVGPIEMPKVVKTDEQWRAQLTPSQFKIARNKGTEAPFCGNLLDNHLTGVYACVCCKLPLFKSESKFSSGTGWPSFFQPLAAENVTEHQDVSYGMVRVEILCTRCDCHLGHVFDDGPRPTGLRYCVNSDSLVFVKQHDVQSLADPAAG